MISLQESVKRAETSIEEAKWENRKNEDNTSSRHFCGSPRDGTRTPKIIVLRDYVVLRIAV